MMMQRQSGYYIADNARVLGDVRIGKDVSIWCGVAIRGDVAPVVIGAGSNVQDNAVVHCDHQYANVIGENVTIGHGAIVHGESIGDSTLVGMGAVVLGHTKIGRGCLIAAGAVVPPGLEVPDGMVVMGVPGKIVRGVSEEDRAYLAKLPPHYVRLAQRHAASPESPTVFEMTEIRNAELIPE